MIKAVMFDFDGTVADTNDVILASWNYTYETLGVPHPGEQTILATFGEPIEYSIRHLFPDLDPEMVVKTYREYQFGHFYEMVKPFPGVDELIIHLHEKGFKLGVVTNRLRPTTLEGIEKFGWSEMLDTVVAYDENVKSKPEPDMLWLALENVGAQRGEAIYVGDSVNDYLCGQRAGVITVGVGWAMAGGENGPITKPDYEIEKPGDLLALINEL
jgi:pyrophosphatase PpaX